MSSTPEGGSLVLRDDLPAPTGSGRPVPEGATLLVACRPGPDRVGSLDPVTVGMAVLAGKAPVLALEQLWVRPELEGRGYGRRIVELVRAHALAAGAEVLTARVPRDHPALAALAVGSKVLGEYLTKEPLTRRPLPGGLGSRPMTADEYATWYEALARAYAQESLARLGGDLDRALERSRAELAEQLPQGLGTADNALLVLTAHGDRVGHLWLAHHRFRGETFGFDLEVVPERRREGWARAAIALAERLALEAGDHRLGLHVFEQKPGARSLYVHEGFVTAVTTYDLLARAAPV